jgi:hypothetical protein
MVVSILVHALAPVDGQVQLYAAEWFTKEGNDRKRERRTTLILDRAAQDYQFRRLCADSLRGFDTDNSVRWQSFSDADVYRRAEFYASKAPADVQSRFGRSESASSSSSSSSSSESSLLFSQNVASEALGVQRDGVFRISGGGVFESAKICMWRRVSSKVAVSLVLDPRTDNRLLAANFLTEFSARHVPRAPHEIVARPDILVASIRQALPLGQLLVASHVK